jgi:hypothetical protein
MRRVTLRRFKAPNVTFGETDIEIVKRRGGSDGAFRVFVVTEQNLGLYFIGREIHPRTTHLQFLAEGPPRAEIQWYGQWF